MWGAGNRTQGLCNNSRCSWPPSLQPQNGHSSQRNGKPSRHRSCKSACSCVSMAREVLKDLLLAPSLYVNHFTFSYDLLLNLVLFFFYELLWFKPFFLKEQLVCVHGGCSGVCGTIILFICLRIFWCLCVSVCARAHV